MELALLNPATWGWLWIGQVFPRWCWRKRFENWISSVFLWDVKLLYVAAEYYKAFPDQAQPESHQLLHYRQHGPSPGGKQGKQGKQEKSRCREARIHPSTSKVDDQLLQEKQTVTASPKPQHQNLSHHGSKDNDFEDGERPSNCVEASKPSLYDERFEKECQPWKDVENEKNLCPSNPSKDNEKIDEDQRHQKFNENYSKASGVPYWVNTRQDYEVSIITVPLKKNL